MHQKKKRRKNS